MEKPRTSRRDFLKSSSSTLGVSWLALNTTLILTACKTAQSNSVAQADYSNLSAEKAFELDAMVDQIIPPDETPGASDTGVVYFIDAALGGFMAGAATTLDEGLADLADKAKSTGNRNSKFSDLSFEQQTLLIKEIEDSQFFGTLHFLTMLGMFCLPKYAGNRDEIGWDLLGFDHRHVWQPPFGYYDAEALSQETEAGPERGVDHVIS